MTQSDILITATRKYCLDLFKQGLSSYDRIADGLLKGVEYFVDEQFTDIELCKSKLIEFGSKSLFIATEQFTNPRLIRNTELERLKFIEFINNFAFDNLEDLKPLPYKRRLWEQESNNVRADLATHWNYDGGYWEPLTECSPRAFCYYPSYKIEISEYEEIIGYLKITNKQRIYEIDELGIDYEIDYTEFNKDSCETIYTDKTNEWIIYISHEGTIAFGGEQFVYDIDNILISKGDIRNTW